MQLHHELRVFWRDSATIQIGLDPRVAVNVTGLNRAEQRFLALLTEARSDGEMDAIAARCGISPLRLTEILHFLRDSGLCAESTAPAYQRPALLSRESARDASCVHIAHIDALSVAIALALARAGIGAITFADSGAVSPHDHPALHSRWLGLPRAQAFLTALRQASPRIRTEGQADIAILTGSQFLDPEATFAFADEGLPHLLAWSEEVDVCIGPLVIPGHSACATCLYKHRVDADSAWRLLAPQALGAPALPIPAHTANMAGEFAARAVLSFLDGFGNTLGDGQWRIPPVPDMPYRTAISPHHECSCTAYSVCASEPGEGGESGMLEGATAAARGPHL